MAGTTSPTRKFLMAQPRPVKVRLHVPGEAAPRELALQAGQSWSKFAETVDALTPTVIEALDASGTLLRAHNTEIAAAAAAEEEDAEPEEVADPTQPLVGDDQLTAFARLLAHAHQSAGERAFQFVEVAFARMVDITNAQNKRLDQMQAITERIQRQWQRAYEREVDEGTAPAPAEGGDQGALLMQMIAQFMSGQQMAGAAAKTNGAANGHAAPGGGTK